VAGLLRGQSESLAKVGAHALSAAETLSRQIQEGAEIVVASGGKALADVAGIAATLKDHAESLDTLFHGHAEALMAAGGRLNDQTDRLASTLQQQAIGLDQMTKRVMTRVQIVEDGLSVQFRTLTAASDQAMTRLWELLFNCTNIRH